MWGGGRGSGDEYIPEEELEEDVGEEGEDEEEDEVIFIERSAWYYDSF